MNEHGVDDLGIGDGGRDAHASGAAQAKQKVMMEQPFRPLPRRRPLDQPQVFKQYGAARIVIEGHTDGSMKGSADPELVKKLSFDRAKAVKQQLVNKFQLRAAQFTVNGLGWSRPADLGLSGEPQVTGPTA